MKSSQPPDRAIRRLEPARRSSPPRGEAGSQPAFAQPTPLGKQLAAANTTRRPPAIPALLTRSVRTPRAGCRATHPAPPNSASTVNKSRHTHEFHPGGTGQATADSGEPAVAAAAPQRVDRRHARGPGGARRLRPTRLPWRARTPRRSEPRAGAGLRACRVRRSSLSRPPLLTSCSGIVGVATRPAASLARDARAFARPTRAFTGQVMPPARCAPGVPRNPRRSPCAPRRAVARRHASRCPAASAPRLRLLRQRFGHGRAQAMLQAQHQFHAREAVDAQRALQVIVPRDARPRPRAVRPAWRPSRRAAPRDWWAGACRRSVRRRLASGRPQYPSGTPAHRCAPFRWARNQSPARMATVSSVPASWNRWVARGTISRRFSHSSTLKASRLN